MDRLPNRRGFLRSAAVASLAVTTGDLFRRTASAAVEPIKRTGGPYLKLSLNAYSFSKLLNDHAKGRGTGLSLLELVEFCAQQDFDGLDATGYFFPGYPKAPPDEYVNELKRRAFDCGLGISGTGVRNQFTTADKAVRAESVRHVKEWVEVAARLGAPVLRVFADTQMRAQTWETVSNGASRDDAEKWIADDVRECAEHGQKFGVIIGVQNHGDFLKTSAEHLSLIRRVDSPWCGPIVDTGYYKTDDPYQDIAAVAPYAVNWQIKESPIGAGSEVRTDLKKLLTIIRQAGYRGYIPIETLSASGQEYDPFVVVPKFLAELREAVEATAPVTPAEAASAPVAKPTVPAAAPAAQPETRPTRKPPNKKKSNSTSDNS
jgi:sugar phosphate isomerase/epimerase